MRELFTRIKYKYPRAREFKLDEGTRQIIFGVYIVVYQKIRYKEIYSIIIERETIQVEKTPQKIWDIIQNGRIENMSRKMLTERLFKS